MLPILSGPARGTRRSLTVLAAVLTLAATALVSAAAPAQAVALPTTTTLAVSSTNVTQGDSVTLTASVSVSGVGGLVVTPSGSVTYSAVSSAGSVQLGSSPVATGCTLSPCTSTLTTTDLPVGDVVVTARYDGDAHTQPSSGTANVHVAPVVVPPTPPTLTATDQVGSVSLHWVAGSEGGTVASYSLYRSATSGGSFTKIAGNLPTGDYQDTTVPTGTTFFYRATTVDADGVESIHSNEASGQSQPMGDGSTFSTTSCAAGQPCESPVVTGSSSDGSTTSLDASTTTSASSHVLTTAVGGPHLVACPPNPPRWLSTTFNDTSSDAYKTVRVVVKGAAATFMRNESGYRDHEIGCLGLGEPWVTAPDGQPAQWSPADGLYVGTAFYCADMAEYMVATDRYSQPCLVVKSSGGATNPGDPNPNGGDRQFAMTYYLPPGDGRVSGSP